MTGTPEDDGLAEIRRLLRSLDETSAGNAGSPNHPRPAKPKTDIGREILSERPPRHPVTLTPPASPVAVGKKQPPPAPRTMHRPAGRPWPLAAVLIAGAATASGLAIWWNAPGLLPGQPLGLRAAGSTDRSDPPQPPPAILTARQEQPEHAPGPAAREANPPPPDSPAPARVAQAVRSQSAVTDAPSTQEPRLRMPARLTATAGQTAPLPLEVDVSAPIAASQVIIVKGLPVSATLSKGNALATGDWSLSAADAKGLAMTLPASATGRHQLAIELRSSDGATVTSVKATLEIAAGPARVTMSDAVRPPETTTLEWLAEAKRLMNAGHIASSRLLLERASDAGLGEAARLLGDTYDPAKLYALGARGVSGDIQRAIGWYERADELGDPQAKARLLALGAR